MAGETSPPALRAAAPLLTPTAANQDGGERESRRAAFRDMGPEGPRRRRPPAPPERAKPGRPRRGGYLGRQRRPSPRPPRPLSPPAADPGRGRPQPRRAGTHPGQAREAPEASWSPWRRAPPPPPRPGERRSAGAGPGPAPAAGGRAGGVRPGTAGPTAVGRALRPSGVGAGG